MKTNLILLLITFTFLSCKKDDNTAETGFVPQNSSTTFVAYVKGHIFDSITGAPLSGYRIVKAFCSNPQNDINLEADGSYFFQVNWFMPGPGAAAGGCFYAPEIKFHIYDLDDNYIKTLSSGITAVHNDTVTVDLLF